MAVEQVKAFLAKVKDDADLAKKLEDAQKAYKGDKDAAIEAVVVPVAKAAGFAFTAAEFEAAFNKGEGEASAEELDAVAGGSSDICGIPVDMLCKWKTVA